VTLSVVALVAALLFTTAGQVLFKLGILRRAAMLIVAGLGLLALATVSNFYALLNLGIGLVYLSTGSTHVLVLIGSWLVLKERIPRDRQIGSLVVILGISLYAFSIW
jgi:drug/metabolite transporter (DMT)-like permease